jgi:outer membrane lipoprotein-sorting protein
LNTAKTLHGLFDLTITAQNINGTINTEIWNATPNKNRTVVVQSTVGRFAEPGSVTVTDGKQLWQYDPQKKVVYNGPVPTNSASSSNGVGIGAGQGAGSQNQFLLTIVQTVFTRSDATLKSSSASVNGHAVYDIHVEPQGQLSGNGTGGFNYNGEVFLDKTTQLPMQVKLFIQGLGNVQLDIPSLDINPTLPDATFTFVVPPGVKVLPLTAARATPDSGSLTLTQAQQQAGYHLLSIPGNQTGYVLQSVNALGAPGSQTYTLNYMKGTINFTIAQGKALANLPETGQQVSIRNTMGYLSSTNGITSLSWTENGVGILINGALSNDQIQAIAKLLS